MALQKLFLGTTTGDKTGTGAKSAGQMINANFDYLEAKIDNVDKLVSETGFSLVGQSLTMNIGWQWLINGVPYTNPAAVVINIPFAAAGMQRIDLIVLNTSNTFTRIAGTESVSNPVTQPVPNDTVQATLIVVTDGVIEQPTAPVAGDAYIAKSEATFKKLSGSGYKAEFSITDQATNFLVVAATSLGSISVSTANKKFIYDGKDHYLKNVNGGILQVLHLSGTGNFKYSFPNAETLSIKNNEIVHFKWRFDAGNSGFLDYVGIVYDKTRIGLGNVDNTSDLNKPVSTAQAAALALKLNSSDYNNRFKGVYLTQAALISAHPIANIGDYAQVNEVGAADVVNYNWDAEEIIWVKNAVTGSGATNTDQLPEGTSNLYFTTARVLATLVSGLSLVTGGAIVSTDSVLVAFGKLQKQINDLVSGKQNKLVAGTNVTIDSTNPLAPIINVNILNANDNVLGTIIPGIRTSTELTITAPNTTYSILNNILNVSKSVGVFQADKFVFSNYGTSTLDNFELEIVGVCKTLGLGIAPFLDSLQTSYKFLWSCRRTNTGMAIASTTSDGTTWTDRITSTNIVLIEKNDLVSFKMTRIKNKIIFTVKNISTGESSDLSFVSNYNETANCQPTMFQYGFQVLDGEWEINSFTVKSNEQKNIDYLFVGDSITQGFSMEDSSVIRKSSSSRFFDLFKNRNTQKISLHASGGAQILDMQTTLNEIGLRNPKSVFLMLGTNGTNQANYQTLINAITAKGISVYPLTIPPTNGTFNAWIKSTYSQYIDASQTLFTGGDSSASTWNATYQGYAGHPNAAGHGVIYDKLKSIINVLKLIVPNLISTGTTSTEINFTWTQSLNNNGYTLQYSTDGISFINLASIGVNGNTYKHSGLTLNQTFYYRILAVGVAPFISSDYSSIVNFSATNDVVLGDFLSSSANGSRIISMNRKLASGIDGWFKCSVSTLTLAQLDRVIFALRHDNLLTGADNWVYHNYMFYYFQDNMIHLSSINADVAPPTIVRQANQWIRLRRTSGTVYYEYSNDNISWVILASRIDSGDLYAQLMFLNPDTQIKSVTVSGTFVAV